MAGRNHGDQLILQDDECGHTEVRWNMHTHFECVTIVQTVRRSDGDRVDSVCLSLNDAKVLAKWISRGT